jgi:GNAT superfamily N-acetyltransferase
VSDLTTAPLVPGDAEEVAHVWRACELHDDGEAMASADDFVALCKRPSMDLGRCTIAVRDGGALVAVGLLLGESTAFVNVLPAHRGRGIGSRLLRWTEEAGLAAGHTRSRQTLSENEARRPGAAGGRRVRAQLGGLELRYRARARARSTGAATRLRAPGFRLRARRA